MNRDFGINQGLVEELFLRWCANPSSVPDEWRQYFDGLPPEEQPELTSPGAVYAPKLDEDGKQGSNGGNGASPRTSLFLPPTAEVVHFVDRRGSDRAGPGMRGEMLSVPPTKEVLAGYELQGRVSALLNAFRVRGHLYAKVDPLDLERPPGDELLLKHYGLERVDPDTVISAGDFSGPPEPVDGRADPPPRGDLLPHHRCRVHLHRGSGGAALAPDRDGVDAATAST